jgi:predicted SAM-dependent methyltransferase
LRIAVPDANHPDTAYYEFVRPNGWGTAPDEHKILYTYQTLGDMLRSVGFEVDLLEYYDENKNFHHTEWSLSDGFILRRKGFTERYLPGENNYTSLIVDGRKPLR